VVAQAKSGAFSDVVLFSHGWNNDWFEATERYDSFVTGYLRQSEEVPFGVPRRTLLVGVFWPSKSFVGAAEQGPEIAGAEAGEVADERADVFELGSTLGDATAERCYQLLQSDGLTVAEAAELVAMFAPLLAAEIAETDESAAVNAIELVRGWASDGSGSMVDDLDELGLFTDGGTEDDQVELDAAAAPVLDTRKIGRALTVWQMKDRAGAVGRSGVAPLLTSLLQTGVRVHCIGHSFGAKVMLSAICAADSTRPVRSVLLLQPAVSHLCFADVVPGVGRSGGYRRALERIELPVLSTFSRHDGPLTGFYHWALRRGRDLGEPDIAADGEPPSRYCALGGFGPRGLGTRSELIGVLDAGQDYQLGRDAPQVYGVDATRTVSSHGAISNSSTWWMLQQLLRWEG
jgi:hypothetical protein